MKIEAASQEKIDTLKPWVDLILEAMNAPDAFITDESRISDLRPYWYKDITSQTENEKWLKHMSKTLSLPVQMEDYIVDVAAKLEALNGRINQKNSY